MNKQLRFPTTHKILLQLLAKNFIQTILRRDFRIISKKWSIVQSFKEYTSEQPVDVGNRHQIYCIRKTRKNVICIYQTKQ